MTDKKPPLPFRLTPDLQSDLTWYWCYCDSELGICSTHGAVIKALENTQPPARFYRVKVEAPYIDVGIWKLKDEKLRLMWQTMKPRAPHPSDHFAFTTPDSKRLRERLTSVHNAMRRLVLSPSGPAHQRILYRVYGPAITSLLPAEKALGLELAPIAKYCEIVVEQCERRGVESACVLEEIFSTKKGISALKSQADVLLSKASEAYANAHQAYVEAETQEAKRKRKARFDKLLSGD